MIITVGVTVLDLFRDFTLKLQEDEMVQKYMEAQKQVDSDEVLNREVEKFNSIKADLNFELARELKDTEKVKELNLELKKLYDVIESNPKMVALNESKTSVNKFVQDLNYILVEAINGADPYAVDPDVYSSCRGGCCSCEGGCH
ncbi:MAG: YlbF family regulator [Oscillospiraceae bacterium]|nr:YlbF family regulator [Oscillospiraceae bacterium]